MKAVENIIFYWEKQVMLLNIVLLFITMAADNSATGYCDSREMSSSMQKDQRTPVRQQQLLDFLISFFPPIKGKTSEIHLKQSKIKFDSVFFQHTARGHGGKHPWDFNADYSCSSFRDLAGCHF